MNRADRIDALWAALLVGPLVVGGPSNSLTVATVVVILAGVAASRRSPLVSLVLASLLSVLPATSEDELLNAWPVVPMAVLGFLAGRRAVDTRGALTTFSAIAALGLAVATAQGEGWTWLLTLVVELAVVLPWWLGRHLRLRADLASAGWERAARLERAQRVVAEQARLRERARIAEDMHDSLGHFLSLLALQAGALEMKASLDPSTREAAAQLRATAVDATSLLHETIGMLREVAEPVTGDPAQESISALVDRARDSGAPVTLECTGERADLATMVDRAAYRVVQESLTNAIKHAPGAPVTVSVAYGADVTRVEVCNPLTPAARPEVESGVGRGRGLLGLHERVRLLGGSLRSGPRDGVFSVVATLPSRGAEPGEPTADQVPGWSAPDNGQHQVRNRVRSQQWRAAYVPLALVVALAAAFLGLRTYTTTTLALDPQDYARMTPGQERAEIADLLPPARMTETLPVVPEPSVPSGATCEYYRTTANPFDLSNDLFRLCFDADGVLVSTDRLSEDTGALP
ncbi:sensor histidine kinase [Modestobacter sp. SYSU DS0875]